MLRKDRPFCCARQGHTCNQCKAVKRIEEQNRVKRPMNAFMIWSKEQRKILSLQNPGIHNSELSKLLGIKWKLMNEQDKFPYVIESKKLRDIHYVKYPDYKYYNHKKVQFYDRDFNNNSTPFIPLMYIDSPSNGNNVEDDTILDPSIMGIYLSRQDILYLLKNEHEFHEYFPAVNKSQNTRVTRSKGVKNEQEVIFDTVSDENVFEESDAN